VSSWPNETQNKNWSYTARLLADDTRLNFLPRYDRRLFLCLHQRLSLDMGAADYNHHIDDRPDLPPIMARHPPEN